MFAKHPRAVFQSLSTWTGGSIAQRLAIGFAGMIAMLLVLAAVNSVEFRGMAARFGHLVEVSNRKVDLAYQMQNHINEMAVQARSISLLTDPKDVQAEVVTLRRAEAAYLAALLCTAGLTYGVLVLLPSRIQTRALRERLARQEREVEALRGSIATLHRDTAALREDPWTVERALRARLGYLRPGERVFRGS